MPERVQLSRAKGWRMPPGTVKVDRTTLFGNPFAQGVELPQAEAVALHRRWIKQDILDSELLAMFGPEEGARLIERRRVVCEALPQLAGKSLACWCRIGTPCHVDTLLELANPAPGS
jgi:hypothetical protein